MTQGDVEERSGLKRSYISRVEGGHTVPSVETLEKWARALGFPLHELFYEGKKPPKLVHLPKGKTAEEIAFGSSKREARFLTQLWRLLARTKKRDQQLLFDIARKMARR